MSTPSDSDQTDPGRAARPGVLVVDDDRAVAEALEDVLQPEFDVQAVSVPEAALAELARRDVAVLLADQRMPGLDGVELLAAARRLYPAERLPFILLTAGRQPRIVGNHVACLAKPVDFDRLLAEVQHLVQARARDGCADRQPIAR